MEVKMDDESKSEDEVPLGLVIDTGFMPISDEVIPEGKSDEDSSS